MAIHRFHRARTLGVAALLGALLLSGCATTQPSTTAQPARVSTVVSPGVAPDTIVAPATGAPPADLPTTAPPAPMPPQVPPAAAPAQPTIAPVPPLSQWQWADYTAPDGAWSISYPANLLKPLDMGGGLVIFISADRGHFYGVDSQALTGPTDAAGLRARAAEALTAIYTSRPATITPLTQTDYPWQAGVSFATERGSEGTAAYYLDSSGAAPRRYGTLLGYKRNGPMELREALYQTMGRLQLTPASAVTRQDPDPGTTAVAGLLDAWMRGEDVRPYLSRQLLEQAAAGRPLDQLLGLYSVALENYAIAAPLVQPELNGLYVIPVTLSYRGFEEVRYFTLDLQGQAWKVTGTSHAYVNAG